MRDYYAILGVSPQADQQTIKRTYRDLIFEHAPDRGGDHDQAVLLNQAYEVLGNPDRRRHYDWAWHTYYLDPEQSIIPMPVRGSLTTNRPSMSQAFYQQWCQWYRSFQQSQINPVLATLEATLAPHQSHQQRQGLALINRLQGQAHNGSGQLARFWSQWSPVIAVQLFLGWLDEQYPGTTGDEVQALFTQHASASGLANQDLEPILGQLMQVVRDDQPVANRLWETLSQLTDLLTTEAH